MKAKDRLLLIFMILLFCELTFADMLSERWNYYKKTFISDDGRIIDLQNNSISHSEGQGYGLLLSVLFDDKETFERVWQWTKFNLQTRKGDNLLAWSWGKHISGKWTVLDYNNATDGDSLIAYALCLAGKKWGKSEYLEEAKKIIRDIREFLIVKKNDNLYLLPGYYGFYREDSLILNPSYYVLPAYKVFAKVEERNFWENFYSESVSFLEKISFGQYGLPPDWIILKNNDISIFSEKTNTFGFEAIRVLLYSVMADEWRIVGKFKKFLSLIENVNYVPQDIDLKEEKISSQDGMAMHYLIVSALAKKLGKNELAEALKSRGLKKLEEEKNYYSYTLSLIVLKEEER